MIIFLAFYSKILNEILQVILKIKNFNQFLTLF